MQDKINDLLEFIDGLEEEVLTAYGKLAEIEKAVKSIKTLMNFYVKNIRKYAEKLNDEEL